MSYRSLALTGVLAVVVTVVSVAVAGHASTPPADSKLEARLRVLLDKQEIHEVMMQYARGVDRGDAALVLGAYHPDAVDDHGGILVKGSETGRFAGPRPRTAKRAQTGQHFIGNELIEVEGDTAYAESYFVSYLMVERGGDEHTRFRAGRYLDRFERRDGKWKIAYRVVVDDWDRLDKVVEGAPGWTNWRRGDLRENDPSATFKSGAMRDYEKTIRAKLGASAREKAATRDLR